MLYAPVGAAKPRRVQGAFVSEAEVENIVSFIKEHSGDDVEYSSDIMDSIERAAAACGGSKKGGGSAMGGEEGEFEGEGDSMLRPATELALETGKISTSLIQRRLSLGYGRAAKLIDEMQARGIVSPPEGQKPRTVLITKQQYMEMVLNRSEDLE
jgi:S-DNA-T family DNA segregation ATPase FtsK/SpoIIIE